MKYGTILGLVCGCAWTVSATTRVWQGTDGVWETASNWNPSGVPAAGDTASFTANATISSAWTLPGNLTVSVAKGKTNHFTGAIGGAANAALTLTSDATDGGGTVYFDASSTFLGDLVIQKNLVHGTADDAFGTATDDTARVYVKAEDRYTKLYLDGIRNLKRIYHPCNDPKIGYTSTVIYSGYNTIGKYQSSSTARTSVNANGTVVITRGISNSGIWLNYVAGTGKMIISNTPANTIQYYSEGGPGPLCFACEGNKFSSGSNINQPYVCLTNAAFDAASILNFRANTSSRLDLNGTTQTIRRLTSTAPSADGAIGTVSSAQPGLVTVTEGDVDAVNHMKFTGAASFEYASTGGKTYTLYGKSTSSGELIASAGTLVLANDAKWTGSVRAKGGTLRLEAVTALSNTSTVRLEGGTLNLPAGTISVKALVDPNGTSLPVGLYGATAQGEVTAVEGLAGDGFVQVLPVEVPDGDMWVWTGEGGDANVSTPGNWATAGGVAATAENGPDFTSFGNILRFPAAATSVFDVAVCAKRVLFDGEGNGTVRFDATAAKHGLSLYHGSLVVTNTATATKTVQVNVPVKFGGDVSLSVLAGDLLRLEGGVASAGDASVVKRGFGRWFVTGDTGAFIGNLSNSNGLMTVSGRDPLGSNCTLNNYQFNARTDTQVYLNNARLTGAFVNRPQGDVGNGALALLANERTTNVVLGKVTCTSGHFRFSGGKNGEITFAGGIVPSNFVIPTGDDFGLTRVSNTVVSVNQQLYFDYNGKTIFALAVPSNSFGAVQIAGTLRTEVNDALVRSRTVYLWSTWGRLDLWGTTQHVANVYHTVSKTNAQGTVTVIHGDDSSVYGGRADLCAGSVKSDRPGAYLALVGANSYTLSPVFGGDVSLERAGTGTNVLRQANASTGEVFVTGGCLRFAAPDETWLYAGRPQTYKTANGGTWAGRRATVTGGTLALGHSTVFPKDVTFRLGGGALALDAGVEQRADELDFLVEGAWVKQRGGRWGALGNTSVDSDHRTALITGPGVLRVGPLGCSFILR